MKSAKPQKESRRWDAPALCEKRLQAPKIGADGGGVGNWHDDNDNLLMIEKNTMLILTLMMMMMMMMTMMVMMMMIMTEVMLDDTWPA